MELVLPKNRVQTLDKEKKSYIAVAMGFVCVGSILIVGYLGYIPLFENSKEKIKVTDMFGRDVTVSVSPNNIVATGAGALRYVAYLDSIDKICGVENIEKDRYVELSAELRPYNLANPEIRDLPSIGPMWGGDSELIVASGAELVLTTNYEQKADLDALQTQLGIPVVGLIYGDLDASIDSLWKGLNLTATVLNKSDRFIEFQTYVLSVLDDLHNRTKNVPLEYLPSCYIGGISYRGAHGMTSTKSGFDPFDFVNAKNVAADLEGDHQFVDKEQILSWDPEIIFVDGGGYALTIEDLNSGDYDTMQAVQDNQIYTLLTYNYYTANFANILVDAYFIGKTLYSGEFEDVNLNSTAKEIYENFVGEDVFDSLMDNFRGSITGGQDGLARLDNDFN